jgi:hypothetical protein
MATRYEPRRLTVQRVRDVFAAHGYHHTGTGILDPLIDDMIDAVRRAEAHDSGAQNQEDVNGPA